MNQSKTVGMELTRRLDASTVSRLRILFFVAFSITLSVLMIGDPSVRVATAISDDHPVMFAELLKNPARFVGDQISVYGFAFAYSSLQNLSIAFLYKYAQISPHFLSFLVTLLQSVLIVVAFLIWARSLVKETTNTISLWFLPLIVLRQSPGPTISPGIQTFSPILIPDN